MGQATGEYGFDSRHILPILLSVHTHSGLRQVFLSNGYWGLFPLGVKLTISLHQLSRLRIYGTVPPFPHKKLSL
jgi:hypothetical protein